jgi:hypothetical protein
MAKALLGYATSSDPRATHRLAGENRVLRQRVSDLEDMVLRLQHENDALASVASASVDEAVARDSSLAHS